MPKLILILSRISIILILFLIFPVKTFAIIGENSSESCSKKGIFFVFNDDELDKIAIQPKQSFTVKAKVPEAIFNLPDWKSRDYYIEFLQHPLLQPRHTTTKIKYSSLLKTEQINGVTYTVFEWTILNIGIGASDFGRGNSIEYSLVLKHTNILRGADVCRGPDRQVTLIDNKLPNVKSCDITMSNNFQIGDHISGKVTLEKIPGITYGYKLYAGDVISKFPRDYSSAVGFTEIPGLNAPNIHTFKAQVDVLEPGEDIYFPDKLAENLGTYTAVIFAESNNKAFACGYRLIYVTYDPTSKETAETGDQSKTQGSLSSAGVSCDPKNPLDVNGEPQGVGGIWTAIGCVPTEPTALIQGILKVAVGAGGGIAFLLMLSGVFQLITSQGNPEALKKGSEQIQSAIIGLLFIIFSVILLKIIGVDILSIPDFKP